MLPRFVWNRLPPNLMLGISHFQTATDPIECWLVMYQSYPISYPLYRWGFHVAPMFRQPKNSILLGDTHPTSIPSPQTCHGRKNLFGGWRLWMDWWPSPSLQTIPAMRPPFTVARLVNLTISWLSWWRYHHITIVPRVIHHNIHKVSSQSCVFITKKYPLVI